MATVLELALDGKIDTKDIVVWLLSKGKAKNLPHLLQEHSKIRQEFIPYFLNYLRDQTLHLLQNSKSNGSPSKTPQSNHAVKHSNKKSSSSSSKRIQLFTESSSENSKEFCTPIYSPGNESPIFLNSAERHRKYDQKFSNCQNKHKSSHSNPDNNRGKYKLSLGEFMSPSPSHQKRRSSPFSTPKDRESSLSPTMVQETRNKSSGKKRATLHTISKCVGATPSPVFRLSENDFPPVNKKGSTRDETLKPKRRINPTQLLPDAKNNAAAKFKKLAEVVEKSTVVSVPYRTKSDSAISTVDRDSICLDDERELLRKEKAKRQQSETQLTASHMSSVCTPSKSSLDRTVISSTSDYVVATTDKITYQDKLNILAILYSRCLDEHLFPNLSVELYFIIQLLTSLCEEDKEEQSCFTPDSEDLKLFLTVHNAVYFSVAVLQKQLHLLKYFDRSVIKLLVDNKRVVDFSTSFQSSLLLLYDKSSSIKKINCCPRSPIGGVSFQADTDNRKNFPNDKLFHQFKKQRDIFYELIREWEEKRVSNGWSVIEDLGDKIRYLINVRTDLVNHLHFARLFLSQLISMCKGDGIIRTEDDDDNIALLAQLKKTNPDKFKKLQERLIQPFSVGGPCPPVSFPGNQEFFKEFIVAASSPVFNQHLLNTFTAKIKKLNNTEFGHNPSEESQESEAGVVNQDQYELFSSCLLTLRLLGKFLGFLTFLPYQSIDSLPDDIQSNYIELRNSQPCPLDILELLHTALATNRLTITLPWIIGYLSMMDKLAPLLHYYQVILYTLQYIHRLSWQKVQEQKFDYAHLMLSVMLGWLFESAVMPQSIYPMELTDDYPQCPAIESTLKPVDNLELINQELLYTVCPYLGELRILLVEFAVGANSRPTIRKITPVAADDLPEPETGRNLQSQLEENFFHNHPSSMKRTVEFVAERTASNFIKHFRATYLPLSLSEARTKVGELISKSNIISPPSKSKNHNNFEYKKLAQSVCEQTKQKVADSKRQYCLERCNSALKLLLPDEQTPAVINMSANISCRMAEDIVKTWITNHISTNMYLKEINNEAEKVCKKVLIEQSSTKPPLNNHLDLPPALLGTTLDVTTTTTLSAATLTSSIIDTTIFRHSDDTISLSELLSQLRELDRELTVTETNSIDPTRVLLLLNTAYQIILYKEDTLPQAIRSLAQLVLDLCLTIITYQPDLITTQYLDSCKTIWSTHIKDVTIFSTVSSIRWFYLLYNSLYVQKSQEKYVIFIAMLLNNNLLSVKMFEKGCLKVFQTKWIDREFIKVILCDIQKYLTIFKISEQQTIVDLTQTTIVDLTQTIQLLDLNINNNQPDIEENVGD